MTTTTVSGPLPSGLKIILILTFFVRHDDDDGFRTAPLRIQIFKMILTSFICHDDDDSFRSAHLRIQIFEMILTSFVCHDDDNGFRTAPLRIVDPQGDQILRVHRQALQRVALQEKRKIQIGQRTAQKNTSNASNTCTIEGGLLQKRTQRSSQLFGSQNLFNSLPR